MFVLTILSISDITSAPNVSRTLTPCTSPTPGPPIDRGPFYALESVGLGIATFLVAWLWNPSPRRFLNLVAPVLALFIVSNVAVNNVFNYAFSCSLMPVRFIVRDSVLLLTSCVFIPGRHREGSYRSFQLLIVAVQAIFMASRFLKASEAERYFAPDMFVSFSAAYWLFEVLAVLGVWFAHRKSETLVTIVAVTTLFFFPIWFLHTHARSGPAVILVATLILLGVTEFASRRRSRVGVENRDNSAVERPSLAGKR